MVRDSLSDANRRLVFVLDNLDRVPVQAARALWTTLRVFAECCENKRNAAWASRTWFIVPYDPSAASRLWDDGEETDAEHAGAGSDSGGDKGTAIEPAAPRLSAAFLDKTFQIRFDVPPLLLEDWQQYLNVLLTTAMPQLTSQYEITHRVYLLSRRMAQAKKRPPTPRHLKLYVNDIGALHRRFGDAFPVDHLALYAILRRQGYDVRLWSLGGSPEREHYESIFGSDSFIESLAALAHGITDVDKARDVHLRTPIESALAKGKTGELNQLSLIPGFWPVFEIICDDHVTNFGTDQITVVNVIEAVRGSKLIESPRPECAAVKRFLERLIGATNWKKFSQVTAGTLEKAIDLGLNHDTVKSSLGDLASVSDPAEIDQDDWINGIRKIASVLEARDLLDEFAGRIHLPAVEEIKSFLIALENLERDEQGNVLGLLCLGGDVEDYVSTLLPVPNVVWNDPNSQALRIVVQVPNTQLSLEVIVESLRTRFAFDQEFEVNEVQQFVATMQTLEVSHHTAAEKLLEAVVESGTLFRRIKNFESAIESEQGAVLLRWAIERHDFSKAPAKPTNAPGGFTLAKEVANCVKDDSVLVHHFVDHCQQHPDGDLLNALLLEVSRLAGLVVAVVKELRDVQTIGIVCSAQTFVARFHEIETVCNTNELPRLDELSSELLGHEIFVKSLAALEISDNGLDGVIHLIQQGAMARSEKLGNTITKFLTAKTIDDWRQSLQSPDGTLRMLAAVRGTNSLFTQTQSLADAFESHLGELLDGTREPTEPPPDWPEICDALPENQQRTIASRIIQRADAPEMNLLPILSIFPGRARDAASAYANESFVRNALSPILKSKDAKAFDWIAVLFEGHPSFWENTSESDRKTFAQELRAVYAEVDDETKGPLRRIGSTIGELFEMHGDAQYGNETDE